jgi:hypothetical protein
MSAGYFAGVRRLTPQKIVPAGLRTYLRWDERHDQMAAIVMEEFGLKLPRDHEVE